jgi:hypothetical protein
VLCAAVEVPACRSVHQFGTHPMLQPPIPALAPDPLLVI